MTSLFFCCLRLFNRDLNCFDYLDDEYFDFVAKIAQKILDCLQEAWMMPDGLKLVELILI